MKLKEYLDHFGIAQNPFSEEDAQTDRIFKDHCIMATFHPAWDKVYGNPGDPSTAVVFGEKGSGKTALRLQMEQHIALYNAQHPDRRCLVVSYDDFNPFLDEFRQRVGRRFRRASRVLSDFQLWDHIDAILSLAVTGLVESALGGVTSRARVTSGAQLPGDSRRRLSRHQRRDLLLLAACYDDSTAAPLVGRWHRLRRKLHWWCPASWWPFLTGVVVDLAVVALILALHQTGRIAWVQDYWVLWLVGFVAGWVPWLWRRFQRLLLAASIARRVRVIQRQPLRLSRLLMNFSSSDLAGQPLPNKDRTDDRYRLLAKLQSILASLDFAGITVLVDRVDEPHLINGSADAMKAVLWPMLDNKFLRQTGLGIKFLLPDDLTQFIDREEREFYQRARLDKQNMIPSLVWSGQSLYDLVNARLAACSTKNPPTKLMDLLADTLTEQRVFEALQSLRTPRHAFKFLYRTMMAHCSKHTSDVPAWRIASETFEAELAIYRRDQSAADRGLAAG